VQLRLIEFAASTRHARTLRCADIPVPFRSLNHSPAQAESQIKAFLEQQSSSADVVEFLSRLTDIKKPEGERLFQPTYALSRKARGVATR
jgi:hypothetical protein